MDDEQNVLPVGEARPASGYPRGRYIALFFILVLMLAYTVIEGIVDGRSSKKSSISDESLHCELESKFSYAYAEWGRSLPKNNPQKAQIESFSKKQATLALSRCRKAVRNNESPYNIRRLIILDDATQREKNIVRLKKYAASQDTEASRRKKLLAEAEMWHQVYLAHEKLSPKQVELYKEQIGQLNLGWYKHFALKALYDRAGMPERAKEENELATEAAVISIIAILMLGVGVLLMGAVGIGLIVWYLTTKLNERPNAPGPFSDLSPGMRQVASGYLLEAFVFYMLIGLGLRAGMSWFHALGVVKLNGQNPMTAVFVVLVGELVWVLPALAFLVYRLRSAGLTLRTVGLTTKHPWRDIMWGIGGYAACLPMIGIAAMISRMLDRYIQTPQNPVVTYFVGSDVLFGRLILFSLGVIAAPLFEELFFRGTFFISLKERWGSAAGILVSAVVFALVHPLPLTFLPIFILGSVFAVLTQQRGSLLPSMVAHALNNAVAFTALSILKIS